MWLLTTAAILKGAINTPVEATAQLDVFANEIMSKWRVPGAAVAVSHNGRLILARGYGSTKPESLFNIGGISKIFTAAAVFELEHKSRLSADARSLSKAGDGKMLRDLIEKVSGETYERFVQRSLLPLDISGVRLAEASSGSSWQASATDLLRLLNALDGRRPSASFFPAGGGWFIDQKGAHGDWWSYGPTPEASAYLFRQAATGVAAAVFFNSRPRDGRRFDAEVCAALLRTLNSIVDWPPVDLFTKGPSLFARDVVNAADHRSGGVAPGEIVVLYPSNAGPQQLVEWPPVSTGETRVYFDDVATPIVYAMAGQVSAIVPHQVAERKSTEVVIEYQGTRSAPVSVPVIRSAPALFTRNASGRGQAAMLNDFGCCNSAKNRAKRGGLAYLFATGEGLFLTASDQKFLPEKPSAGPVPVSGDLKVTVGGVPAQVVYAGDAGVLQINIRIPENAPVGGAIPVVLTVGENSSSSAVTMAIRSPVPHVLVLEPEGAFRRALVETLRRAGFEASPVFSEQDIAWPIRRGPVDLIIASVQPQNSFIPSAIEKIQNDNPRVKILALADRTGPSTARAADLLGAQALLSRFVASDVLLRRVRELAQDHLVAF